MFALTYSITLSVTLVATYSSDITWSISFFEKFPWGYYYSFVVRFLSHPLFDEKQSNGLIYSFHLDKHQNIAFVHSLWHNITFFRILLDVKEKKLFSDKKQEPFFSGSTKIPITSFS